MSSPQPTKPKLPSRQEQVTIMWPKVIKLLFDKDSGLNAHPGATCYRLLGTSITGSDGYYSFHAHLTITKADFNATLRACVNPMKLTPAQLLAGILKRVNYHVTIAVWQDDYHKNNPRRFARHSNPRKMDWHTYVDDDDDSNEAEAARKLCAATGKVADELEAAFTEATDFLQGKSK